MYVAQRPFRADTDTNTDTNTNCIHKYSSNAHSSMCAVPTTYFYFILFFLPAARLFCSNSFLVLDLYFSFLCKSTVCSRGRRTGQDTIFRCLVLKSKMHLTLECMDCVSGAYSLGTYGVHGLCYRAREERAFVFVLFVLT